MNNNKICGNCKNWNSEYKWCKYYDILNDKDIINKFKNNKKVSIKREVMSMYTLGIKERPKKYLSTSYDFSCINFNVDSEG